MGRKEHTCQLCGNKHKAGIEIFSQKGVQLSMKSIIYQHFSLEFTEADPESKIVCKKCWKITDSFHRLYCLVKDVVVVLNNDKQQSIKFPPIDSADYNAESMEQLDFIGVGGIVVKSEPNDDNHPYDDDVPSSPNPNEIKSVVGVKDENAQQKDDELDNDRKPKLEVKTEQLTKRQSTKKTVYNKTIKQFTPKQLAAIEQDKEIKNSLGIVCELCDKHFKTFTVLNKHFERKHKSFGYIRCCQRKYRTRSSLYDHIQDHKDPFRLQCPVCAKKFIDKANLNKHIKSHEPNSEKYYCPHCPKTFERQANLNSHIEWIHSVRPKLFICDICGKNFVSRSTIASHILKVHVREYSQICDICAKEYKSKKQLDSHYRTIHLGIQTPKIQCTICGSWLLNKDSLRNHMRYHYSKEETCPICGKKAPNRNAIGNHIRKVHSGLVYSCTMCEKKFKKQKSLTEHISTHTGYNLYQCKFCPMEFNYESSLYKHRKDVHSTEIEEERSRKVLHCNTPIKKIDIY